MMSITDQLIKHLKFTPTAQQEDVFNRLAQFISLRDDDECFILRGYAGTGKTSIIASLVKVLPSLKVKTVLLAPTGRAAKVISSYSGKKAYTIHKRIYRSKGGIALDSSYVLAPNPAENTLFIVDEASMISSHSGDFSQHNLLQDLVSYVYNTKNCKLILVGDTAQLPPVGSAFSPALDAEFMRSAFALNISDYEMTDVVRQEAKSGILYNATLIRNMISESSSTWPLIQVQGFKDIYKMTGERLPEGLEYAYNTFGIENTLVICRSNKSANTYNQQIRNRILYREEELTGGDYVMVVKNNYYWLQKEQKADSFIANGDIAKIIKVRNIQEQYGFRFVDVLMEFIDYPDEEPLHCKVLLETLYSNAPGLTREDSLKLYQAILQDYAHISSKRKRMEEMKNDPYFNALQIKFAYAVTCHKAQGGQWDAVFIDQGYLTEEMLDTDFMRWLYTAFTRSVKQLFLVNFSKRFFLQNNEDT